MDVREFDADDLASHAPLVASIVADHGPIGTAVLAFGVLGDQARAEKDPAHAAAVLHTDFVAQASLLTVLANTMRSAGHGRDRRVLVRRRRAGATRQLRLRLGEGGAGRVLQRPGRRTARLGRAAAARAARIRDRADDRGHDAGALSSTPPQVAAATARALAKGRRTVWIPWTLRPFFVGMRLLPQFVWRRMPR